MKRSAVTLLKPFTRPPHAMPRPNGSRSSRYSSRHATQALPNFPARSSVIDCAAYVGGARYDVENLADAVRMVRASSDQEPGAFVWVGLHEPDKNELEYLAEVFELHPLAVEDAIHAHQRPKLERYDDMLFAVLKTVHYVKHERLTANSQIVGTGEIMVFAGADFVITVRHDNHYALRPVRRQLEDTPELLALGPAAVVHAVADRVVDGYLNVADAIQADIDEVETSVFSPERTRDVERIYQLKRELIELKRAVTPLAEPLRLLASRPYPVVHSEIREYFRDVEDHLARVREHVESFDELLTSILQASLAQATMAENEDMRKISAWVAIFAVPTMIAGIYGMNFDYMPALDWKLGYPLVLLVIALSCALLYRGFRRNGWL